MHFAERHFAPARSASFAGGLPRGAARLVALAVAVALAGAVAVAMARPETSRTARSDRHPAALSAARADRHPAAPAAAAPTSSPTVDQLAGQRVIYAYAGLQPPPSLLAAIRSGEAGGVIFFAPNIADDSQIRSVIARLQRLSVAGPTHQPLLMLTDQEGGEVRRLPGAPELSEREIGQQADPEPAAAAAGAGAGLNLRAVGMNVNLAPVLDVYRSPGNFIDEFARSYSRSPTTVAALGAAFIAAQQRTGVAATAKHFPGLGAASQTQNTDERPVTLNLSATVLRTRDELPYRNAVAAGVKLVMLSWARYPALDPARPAGLSPTIVEGELRDRLGFKGVTITDGIEAGAVTPYGSLAARAVQAALAGDDLILCAATQPQDNSPAIGIAVREALAAAITTHRLSMGSARAAASQILQLRARP